MIIEKIMQRLSLSLTLSRRERELKRCHLPPLPPGEGRGEGTFIKQLSAAFFVCLVTTPSFAAPKEPIDYRRTISFTIAQKTVNLEAPPKMCFLDRSQVAEEAIMNAFRGVLEKDGQQQLIGVFADCNKIVNLGAEGELNDLPLNSAAITWLNPSVGEMTELSRQDYLDMREAGFVQYAEAHAGVLKVSKNIHRSAAGIVIGMSGNLKIDYVPKKGAAVIGTTTIRHIPLEITWRHTGKEVPALDKLYPVMDKWMSQQIALNE